MRGTFLTSVAMFVALANTYAPPVCGDLIAYWHFNDSDLIVDEGLGTLTTNFPAADISFLGGTTKNAFNGAAAGLALTLRNQANNGVGYVDFAINMESFSSLRLSLATQKTSTGFINDQVQFSADGGANFANFGAPHNPPVAFDTVSYDLSELIELDNNANAVIRLSFAGATSTTGNNRLDNVLFEGASVPTSVPEPSMGLLVCAIVAALWSGWGRIARRWMTWLAPSA